MLLPEALSGASVDNGKGHSPRDPLVLLGLVVGRVELRLVILMVAVAAVTAAAVVMTRLAVLFLAWLLVTMVIVLLERVPLAEVE